MSLDDILERPAPAASLSDPASAWVTVGTCPPMAAMNNYPVALQRDGITYVISGGDGGNTVLTSDDDGVTWNAPQTGDWPVRRALSAALHDGKFYIVGGFSPGKGFSDTLVSDDGLSFTQLGADPPPWGVRWAHTLLSAGGKLLMIAGVAGPVYSDQVWSMDADGTWTKIAEGQFTRRAWAAGAVLGSKLLVIGGWNDTDGAFAETLVSDDGGANWSAHPFPADLTGRHSAAAVAIGDTVYLVGGCTGRPGTTFYSDTWATKDGVTWSRLDQSFGPIGRTFAAATLGGKLGVIGSSADIIALTATWSVIAESVVASIIYEPSVAEFQGTTYACGGMYSVLAAPDGVQWASVGSGISSRSGPAACVHDGKLWLSGGAYDSVGQGCREVWRTPDGTNWTRLTDQAAWPNRLSHGMISYNGRLWVLGGASHSPTYRSDVWWSEDGVNWYEQPGGPPARFSGRDQMATAVFLDRLWVLGGHQGSYLHDVWSMDTDGVWRQHADAAWAPRACTANVRDGVLYVVGGQAADGSGPRGYRDVWATTDGETWRQLDGGQPTVGLGGAGWTLKGDDILVFGGVANGARNEAIYRFPLGIPG